MIRLHRDNCIFHEPACRGAKSSIYINKTRLQSGQSSLNTQTHAIQMNFSTHDKDFKAEYFVMKSILEKLILVA